MPTTKNLGLYVADDDTFKTDNPTVISWRSSINGEGEGGPSSPYSDMQIIDQAFGQILEQLLAVKRTLENVNGIEE